MKGNSWKYIVGGFVAGICSFSACTSEIETIPETYDKNCVKTQFALSVPDPSEKKSRMTHDVVQVGQFTFRGLQNLLLYPMFSNSQSGGEVVISEKTMTQMSAPMELDEMESKPGYVQNKGDLNDVFKDMWFTDVQIPQRTNAFLMYAEAKPVTGQTDYNQNGALEVVGSEDFKTLEFKLRQIVNTGNAKNEVTNHADKFLQLLNGLLATEGTYSDAPDAVTVSWRNVRQEMHYDYYGLYQRFVAMTAGSSANILKALEGLYNELDRMPSGNGTLKSNLMTFISNNPYVGITCALRQDQQAGSGQYDLSFSGSDGNFPAKFNLPDGGMSLGYVSVDGVGKFIYAQDGSFGVTPLHHFVYPAALRYVSSTPLLALDKSHEDLNLAPTSWADLVSKFKALGAAPEVGPVSRSIILPKPLQYGVALLESHARLTATSLPDNNPAGEELIDLSKGLKMTGVLVGGQCNVDWSFHPLTGNRLSGDAIFTVYDNVMVDANERVVQSDDVDKLMAYTLLTESPGVPRPNENVAMDNNESISVALEFYNDFADFYGVKHKLIPKGTKFYLVADLVLVPPGNPGQAQPFKKVFIQDHKTVANFSISSLKNAYNVIPDLRTPKLEVGIAVDIKWNMGLDFGTGMDEDPTE